MSEQESAEDQHDDATTIAVKEGVDLSDAPLRPAEVEDITLDDADVLAAVTVNDADARGGVWGLSLNADFAAHQLGVGEVKDRLTEGTYALVRIDGGEDSE